MAQRTASGSLGAHVSTQGGVPTALGRGLAIGASALQVFTKTPNQWREPVLGADVVEAFRRELGRSGIASIVSHDSYLINLASPDPALRKRSGASFRAELGAARPSASRTSCPIPATSSTIARAGLSETPRRTPVASRPCRARWPCCSRPRPAPGTSLGSTFEELAELRDAIGAACGTGSASAPTPATSTRRGTISCATTTGCGADGTTRSGSTHLRCLHLNDSKTPFDSRRDRHELIAEGSLGPEPFRRIMRDRRFAGVMKILETPKGDDEVTQDRRMLRRLRAYARVRPAR